MIRHAAIKAAIKIQRRFVLMWVSDYGGERSGVGRVELAYKSSAETYVVAEGLEARGHGRADFAGAENCNFHEGAPVVCSRNVE